MFCPDPEANASPSLATNQAKVRLSLEPEGSVAEPSSVSGEPSMPLVGPERLAVRGTSSTLTSKAPMSGPAPRGRPAPRWSVAGKLAESAVSMAGLPLSRRVGERRPAVVLKRLEQRVLSKDIARRVTLNRDAGGVLDQIDPKEFRVPKISGPSSPWSMFPATIVLRA